MAKPFNPNPRTDQLEATQFKPGQSGNPGGNSSAVIQLRKRNAELSYALQNKGLEAMVRMLEHADDSTIADMIAKTETIALTNKAIDRQDGTPTQSVDVTSRVTIRIGDDDAGL